MCLFFSRYGFVTSANLKKFVFIIILSVVLLFYQIFVYSATNLLDHNFRVTSDLVDNNHPSHKNIVNLYYKSRQSWPTSNLGSILFKNIPSETFKNHDRDDKMFLILIWEHWNWLRGRHILGFNNLRDTDPFSQCSVRNCVITGNNSLLDTADAVVIHIQKGRFPNTRNRKRTQRWIFLNDESPFNAFSMAVNTPKLSKLANVFNWSMTYRSDADVPVPYGRTVPLSEPTTVPIIPYWNRKQRDVLAGILLSNCVVSERMQYLNELKQHIAVDVHGRCSTNNKTSCPGHFRSDCELMAQYLFYLVFENSMCREYLSEKSFYHAYGKGAIPVIMGASVEECEKLLPPNSYLHVDNFETPLHLANEMIDIGNNLERLLSYHEWRNNFKIVNEHGYFGSKSLHYCRVCEALNYNDEGEKVYSEEDLKEFLEPSKTCRRRQFRLQTT